MIWQGMTADIFTALYGQGAPFCLIDSRERRDYVQGHWFGSTNIPYPFCQPACPFYVQTGIFPFIF